MERVEEMSVVEVDARGMTCPEPLLATKKALEGITSGVITTLVDNEASKENVIKFAVSQKCSVIVEEKDGVYSLRITKQASPVDPKVTTPVQVADMTLALGKSVYLITHDSLGHGNDELGRILIKSFFVALQESQPKTLMFLNSGVKLAVQSSPVLAHLKTLEADGVEVLVCGTCLDYYQLKDQLAVGSISNMYTIVENLNQASQAITL
jgi:selenium metabolism protein YedF